MLWIIPNLRGRSRLQSGTRTGKVIMSTSASGHQAILNAAQIVARIYSDSETVHRLEDLAAEVRDAEGAPDNSKPVSICSICGGNVDVGAQVRCQECDFVFTP